MFCLRVQEQIAEERFDVTGRKRCCGFVLVLHLKLAKSLNMQKSHAQILEGRD